MEIRRMAGWCLILWGAIKVLHAIHIQTVMGQSVDTLSAVMITLLITVGAAFLWLDKVPWRSKT